MAALDNIYSGYEINKNLNPSYNGALFQIWSRDSGDNVFIDVPQNADGEPDLVAVQAHAKWNPAHNWGYEKAYDPWGNTDWDLHVGLNNSFIWSTNRSPKFWDAATQSFSTDPNNQNRLIIPKREGDEDVATVGTIPLGIYSIFVRNQIQNPTPSVVRGLVGTKPARIDPSTGYAPLLDEGGTNGVNGFNMGSPSYYKDGVLQNLANAGEAWTAYANEPVNVAGVVNFDLSLDRTVAEKLWVFNPFPGFQWGNEYHTGILLYTGDVSANVGQIAEIQTLLDDIYDPAQFASGSVSFNDVAFSNGVVDFFSAPSPTGTLTLVDSDVAINSGVATMTTERDPLKDYFGVARGITQDFTGTLASAPAGDVISTGLDLTGISIGGANDDHYIFRATGGTGAGTEVTVKSRTGGDITVTDASAFATGTEFTIGRFVRGISRVFPKD